MTEPTRDVDLSTLARRDPSASIPPARSKRQLWIPVLVVVALAAALARPLIDVFAPRVAVRVVRPVRHDGGSTVVGGAAVLSTSGFVEPDPTPTRIAALTPGVVRDVLVQPGDAVLRDQVVATLVDDDARIAHDRATAALAVASAEVDAARALEQAAREAFDANLDWTEALASAIAETSEAQALATAALADVAAAEAKLTAASTELELDRLLVTNAEGGTIEVRLAEAEVAQAQAAKDAAMAASDARRAAVSRAQARSARVEHAAKARIDDRAEVATTAAARARAEAALALARAELDATALALSRTQVRALVPGIVHERRAGPGDRVGEPESPPIFSTFQPEHVRVRADVPQQDAFSITVGMPARITLDGTDLALDATVVRHVPAADLTKSTIAVHVAAKSVDARLVPDLLVRVQFLAPANASSAATSASSAVVVPSAALRADGTVLVVDADDRARTRTVTTAGKSRGELVVVTDGLSIADRVIVSAPSTLSPGDRVAPEAEAP